MNRFATGFRPSSRGRPSIINVVQFVTFVVISIFGLAVIVLIAVSAYVKQQERADEMRESYTEVQRNVTRREVERVVETVRERIAVTREEAESQTRERVYLAAAIAENIHQTFRETKTDEEILQMVITTLQPMKFDLGKGYYFVFSTDGQILLSAAHPEMEGRHFSTLKSNKAREIISETLALVERRQEGMIHYEWGMPGETGTDHPKLSHVQLFEPLDIVIGAGLYLDDVESEAKQKMLEEITRIKYGTNGYFFVNTLQGQVIAHGLQSEMVGTSIWDYEDSRGINVFQVLREAVRNPEGGFCYYWWEMPETGVERPKLAFAKAIPEWNWLIGTGLYLDEVESDVKRMESKHLLETLREVALILLIMFAAMLLVYMVLGIFFRALRKDFGFFALGFSSAANENVAIDEKKIRFKEFLHLARNANHMLSEKALIQQKVHDEKQQLYVTLQSIRDAVIVVNQEHEIALMNDVAQEMTGCSEREVLGKKLADVMNFFDEQKKEPVSCPVRQYLGKESLIELPEDTVLIGDSGRKYNVEIVTSPIIRQDRTDPGTIIVLRDITEKRKVEEERLRLKKLESVGVLAGGIAHDFNNLLTSLFGNIDLAKMHADPESPAYEYITRAGSAIDSAKNLSNQLLTFAKGGQPIRKAMDLKNVLVPAAEFSIRGTKVELEAHIAEDLLPVKADEHQISQVISNLMINAQQAMPEGGKVMLTAENEGSDWIRIMLADQGVGIPASIRDKIFDPYFTTKGTGSGLGLATCHSIVLKHGGTIKVDSELGRGACFTIRLPASTLPPPRTPGKVNKTVSDDAKTSGRILVVDDLQPVRHLVVATLSTGGFQTEEACNLQEAQEAYANAMKRETPFDAVIIDLTIPGGPGGEEIAKALLELDPKARLVVSSGYADSPVMAHFDQFGFMACIVKPYSAKELVDTVRKVLQDGGE